MSQLGSGSGSGFPGEIDNYINEVDSPRKSKTLLRADIPNDLYDAIVKIETELGTDPAGSKTDVKTRLTDVETTHGQFIVAASDSKNKTYADYTCDGTDDDVEIQAAIDAALSSQNGKIILLPGTYSCSSTIDLAKQAGNDIKLTIEGKGAVLESTANPVIDIKTHGTSEGHDNGIEIYGVYIRGDAGGNGYSGDNAGTNTGIKITDSLRVLINCVAIKHCDMGINFDHATSPTLTYFTESCRVINSYITKCNQGIVFTNSVGASDITSYDNMTIRDCMIYIGLVSSEGASTDACIKFDTYCRLSRSEINNCLLIHSNDRNHFYCDSNLGSSYIDFKGESNNGTSGHVFYIGSNYEDTNQEHQAVIHYGYTAGGITTEIYNPNNKRFHAVKHSEHAGFAIVDKNGVLTNKNGQLNSLIANELLNSPAALWLFNDGSGNRLTDLSGNAKHVTVNGASWATKFGNWGALDFDGTDDYANSGGDSITMDGDRMVIIALEPDTAYTGSSQMFWKWYEDANNYLNLKLDGSNNLTIDVSRGGTYSAVQRSYAYNADEVIIIAVTISGNDVKLWVNGEVYKSGTNSGAMVSTAGDFYIGAEYGAGSLFYDGEVFFCAVYDYVSEEIIRRVSRQLLSLAKSQGPQIDVKKPVTISADDTTPDVRYGTVFKTSANTVATAITNFDNGYDGQRIVVIGGSDTNASTLQSGANLKLSGSMTLGQYDSIELIFDKQNDVWIEIGRNTWDGV